MRVRPSIPSLGDVVHVAITGGARGIGLAIAEAFTANGAIVSIGDIDLDEARTAAVGIGARAVTLDVREPGSWDAFLAEIGPLDVLVNNAGIVVGTMFADTPAALRDLQIDVNLRGVVNGMAAVLPSMLARGRGQIINVASLAGRIATPRAALYTATKFAVVGLTEAVRAELHGTGVSVAAVLPTFVPTRMTAGLSLRGLPTTTPERVAAAVVRASHRGAPAVVAVPRWLGIAPRLASWMPQWMQDALRSRARRLDRGSDDPRQDEYAQRVRDLLR